jgi:hypothetical protein
MFNGNTRSEGNIRFFHGKHIHHLYATEELYAAPETT